MKKMLLTLLIAIIANAGHTQENPILTFTGANNTTHVQLDSIKITNRTQNCDTVLFWPDTVLDLSNVGISEIGNSKDQLQVFQNQPNPVAHETKVSIHVPNREMTEILITDVNGRTHISKEFLLDRGTHEYQFTMGAGKMYLFTARNTNGQSSIKILGSKTQKNRKPVLKYIGTSGSSFSYKQLKTSEHFAFNPGDQLLLSGYYDILESGLMATPESNQIFVFQFAYNIPCPGKPIVDYGGKVYSTVQIFNQCWLKQNLDVGGMIPGEDNMQDNGSIEKYCYNDSPANCNLFGGLYQWEEMMQYSQKSPSQGICPDGWRLPTDRDWNLLEGAADSHYPAGDPEWDDLGFCGFDAGLHLKTTSGWNGFGNGTDQYGFGAVGGGSRDLAGTFNSSNSSGYWWSSSEYSDDRAYQRSVGFNYNYVIREISFKPFGYSVRCLFDNNGYSPISDFSTEPAFGFVPLSVSFIDETSNDPVSWFWNFGDGNFSSDQNPEHIYQETGSYTVSLVTSNVYGTDTIIKVDNVHVVSPGGGSPCEGLETVEYEGRLYNTVLIGNQCWMKENLNVGEMIQGDDNMAFNETIEKYCYDNDPVNCDLYGGLYQWDEIMQYILQQGVQGICPEGWHIPTDAEWKTLEGTVDSLYQEGDPIWEELGTRGYNAGKNLKSAYWWENDGNGTNIYGFSGLPGGRREPDGSFVLLNNTGHFWSSSEYATATHAWYRSLKSEFDGSGRTSSFKTRGLSVRCMIADYGLSPDGDFSAVPVFGTAPLSVYFTDQSMHNTTEWHWDFGDGNTSTDQNPDHIYQDTGFYTVTLIVTNAFGSDTVTKTDFVNVVSGGGGEPCPGMETITYEGQEYNTVLIDDRCWLKENLNVGFMITGQTNMSNNGTLEKYCYDNNPVNCELYGALYQWDEAMQYTTQKGEQGICPEGWHIPTEEELKILEGTVDSVYPVGDPIWEENGMRGFDVGKKLKSLNFWNNSGYGTDAYGFSLVPGGRRDQDGTFLQLGDVGSFWSSSEYVTETHAWYRHLKHDFDGSYKTSSYKTRGFAVRCIHDDE